MVESVSVGDTDVIVYVPEVLHAFAPSEPEEERAQLLVAESNIPDPLRFTGTPVYVEPGFTE
jgi:hypothetical protein